MSLTYEDFIQLFCIHCKDVGLDCNWSIYGISEENVIDNTILHMFECHAIKPEEMTSCMSLKIKENVRIFHSPPLKGQLVYTNQSW
jgi:predicted small metal-binding protein